MWNPFVWLSRKERRESLRVVNTGIVSIPFFFLLSINFVSNNMNISIPGIVAT